jgi:NADP-dependent aldehyde dehydrogenase
VLAIDGPDADAFVAAATEALAAIGAQVMLTDGIAAAFRSGRDRIAATAGARALLTTTCDQRNATPAIYEVSGKDWLANAALGHEVFGPLGLIIRVADAAEMEAVARALEGQLTCTLQMEAGDTDLARRLMPVLERKAGRVLANGFPTGVEVCEAMVHGGPYPASTNFGATSVGTMAIRRWLRPVSYQNLPAALLPTELQ